MSTPLFVLTGFLGSGKTTLLSRLLERPSPLRTAVLINEVGEISLDHHLVERVEEDVAILSSGCICCTIRGALAESLTAALAHHPDRLVLETTGLANPAPVLHALSSHPDLSERLRLGATVVTVDAFRGEGVLDDHEEARAQLALADRVVLTKVDIAAEARVAELEARVRREAPGADLTTARDGDAPVERVWSEAALEGLKTAERAQAWLHHHPHHDHEVETFTVELDEPVDGAALALWLSLVTQLDGPRLLRIKGIVRDREGRLVLLQAAEHAVAPPRILPQRPAGWRGSRLVLVTRNLPARARDRLIESARSAASGARRR